MAVMVDTSAIIAILDAYDVRHAEADAVWRELVGNGEVMHISNYALLETISLVQRRFGPEAAARTIGEMEPLFTVHWVNADLHSAAEALFLTSSGARRSASLVDCVVYMESRRLGVRAVFTYDKHFRGFGFPIIG